MNLVLWESGLSGTWADANSTGDSDVGKIMERPDTETETEECYPVQKYHDVRRKQGESHHDLKHKCCLKCNQPWTEVGPSEFGRRRRRTKDQVQHCPSCHCPPETVKYSIGRTKYV